MECFEPGRVIVGPGSEGLTREGRAEYIQRELQDDVELDFGVEDVLAMNELEVDEQTRKNLPFVMRVPEGREDALAARIRQLPKWIVGTAVPDYTLRPSAAITLDNNAIDQAVRGVNAIPGGSICGYGCKVAVIDSGLDPALVAGITRQYDALSPNAAAGTPFDPTGHGTLVAAIISRIAPGATIVPIRAFDTAGALSNALAALYVAKALGCHVVNMSFSLSCSATLCGVCGSPGPAAMNLSQLTFLFQQFLHTAPDSVLVAAGGNNVAQLTFPAAISPVIAVGSFDFANQTPLSAYAQVPVDRFVLAPGGQGLMGQAFAQRVSYSRTSFLFGTSFATAFASGFAAKVVCARINGCITPIKSPGLTHAAAVLDELKGRADISWHGFDVNKHGLGALHF